VLDQCGHDKGPIEKLIAAFTAGFGDQQTAMTGGAMGVTLFQFAVGFVAGAEGVVGAQCGTYQESCPLGVLELNTFLKLTSI
jgi:hypothetical protein